MNCKFEMQYKSNSITKKYLSFLLVVILAFQSAVLKASAENNEISSENTLKGKASVNDYLKKDTKLKISFDKDISGADNQVGDEFTATILNDLNVNDANVVPVGSLVIGHIENITHSGKASMQGYIEISLDKILLPSGKYIPLTGARFAANGKYTNKNRNLKGEGNGLARGVGLGVVKGATLTFIPGNKAVKATAIGAAATGAVFSGGWSVTSTAVIGGITGLVYGLKKHGSEAMIASGQVLEIELDKEQDFSPFEVAIDDIMNQGVQTNDRGETVIK